MIGDDSSSREFCTVVESPFARECAKRKKLDSTLSMDEAVGCLEGEHCDALDTGVLISWIGASGYADDDEDLVRALLSDPPLHSTVCDGSVLDRELSTCLSQPWMFDDTEALALPLETDVSAVLETGDASAIMKKSRSLRDFVLVSENPKDVETPFVVEDVHHEKKDELARTPSSDQSSDGYFSQGEQQGYVTVDNKHFKLACLAGYLKSLIEATYSSRHVASGVPCITPKSIEECLVPQGNAADDLARCFFDSTAIDR